MIPKASITAWRKTAPWGEDWQVEQDLILSRALVDTIGPEGGPDGDWTTAHAKNTGEIGTEL